MAGTGQSVQVVTHAHVSLGTLSNNWPSKKQLSTMELLQAEGYGTLLACARTHIYSSTHVHTETHALAHETHAALS